MITTLQQELEEIRSTLDGVRTLVENLFVRGLRTCGPGEQARLGVFSESLEQSGAGRLGSLLGRLRDQIAADDRGAARTLLLAQTHVLLLDRLLTLRVVSEHYRAAIEVAQAAAAEEQGARVIGLEEPDAQSEG